MKEPRFRRTRSILTGVFLVSVLALAGYFVWVGINKTVPFWETPPESTTTTTTAVPVNAGDAWCRGVADGQALQLAYSRGRDVFYHTLGYDPLDPPSNEQVSAEHTQEELQAADAAAHEAALKLFDQFTSRLTGREAINSNCQGLIGFAINNGFSVLGPKEQPLGGGGGEPSNS